MKNSSQLTLHKINWKHRYSHGGSLRQLRQGRQARPLSTKEPLHLVFKANCYVIKGGFRQPRRFALIHHLVQKYKFKFYVKVEQISIQGDHLHLLIRTTRRSNYQSFFRVVAGQIAQRFEKEGLLSIPNKVTDTPMVVVASTGLRTGADFKTQTSNARARVTDTPKSKNETSKLWKWRPFSRVVQGWKAYQIVRHYIQLNEREVLGEIPYRKERLRGLSSTEWEILWS